MTHNHKTGPFAFGQLQSMALNIICLTKMAKEKTSLPATSPTGFLSLSLTLLTSLSFSPFHIPFFSIGFSSCSPWTLVTSSSNSCRWLSVQGSDAMNGLFSVLGIFHFSQLFDMLCYVFIFLLLFCSCVPCFYLFIVGDAMSEFFPYSFHVSMLSSLPLSNFDLLFFISSFVYVVYEDIFNVYVLQLLLLYV